VRLPVKAFFVTALVLAAGCGWQTQGQTAGAGEQMAFSENTPVQHPVALRPDTLRALFETPEARQVLNFASDATQDDPSRLFRAEEADLTGAGEADLVVVGVPPMTGAESNWFWVVRSTRNGPRVVLFTSASTLSLAETTTNGYRDIVTTRSSATETQETTFHFDGKSYKGWKKTARSRN
jgi:hypothetical protein